MAIYFRDFQGRYLNDNGCMFEPEIEPISVAVELANRWIAENAVKVINVETVLTNLNRESVSTLQYEGGRNKFRNAQIVRVWLSD
jgi:hypothetical protein